MAGAVRARSTFKGKAAGFGCMHVYFQGFDISKWKDGIVISWEEEKLGGAGLMGQKIKGYILISMFIKTVLPITEGNHSKP